MRQQSPISKRDFSSCHFHPTVWSRIWWNLAALLWSAWNNDSQSRYVAKSVYSWRSWKAWCYSTGTCFTPPIGEEINADSMSALDWINHNFVNLYVCGGWLIIDRGFINDYRFYYSIPHPLITTRVCMWRRSLNMTGRWWSAKSLGTPANVYLCVWWMSRESSQRLHFL